MILPAGLPWTGSVQRGGFLLKEFWNRIVLWPDACLVELTMSYVQFQSPLLSSKVLCSVEESSDQFKSLLFSSKVLCSVQKSSAQLQSPLFSSTVLCSVPKSSVQVAKFSSSVFL